MWLAILMFGFLFFFYYMYCIYLSFSISSFSLSLSLSLQVSIRNCTTNINEPPSQRLFIKPGEQKNTTFILTTTTSGGTENQCTAYLSNSLGDMLDEKVVSFITTKAYAEDPVMQYNYSDPEYSQAGDKIYTCQCTVFVFYSVSIVLD